MMGEPVGRQARLFYEFDLEDMVPGDHLLHRIDAVLELSWLRSELAPTYSHTGCPSVDPELLIRMLIVGYCYSIRSERRLCQEVHMNLAYRWFCRLGLEGRVPHHSTFSVNRHGRFGEIDPGFAMPHRAHIDPPTSSDAIMQRAQPHLRREP